MIPVQKVVSTYKTAMDFKSQTHSSPYHYQQNSKHSENSIKSTNHENKKESFQSILKKALKNN